MPAREITKFPSYAGVLRVMYSLLKLIIARRKKKRKPFVKIGGLRKFSCKFWLVARFRGHISRGIYIP